MIYTGWVREWGTTSAPARGYGRALQAPPSSAPDPGICYGGGGLPEGRQCMRSCLNGGGGCSPLTTGGGGVQSAYDGGGSSPLTTGGGGGGGCSRQVTLINSSLTCTHSLLKHKKHHGKRVHSAPALSCSTASLTFVRTTELSGLLSMAQHVICRSLSSGRGGGGGGGRQKLPGGGISYAMGGGRPPPPRLCWIRGCPSWSGAEPQKLCTFII